MQDEARFAPNLPGNPDLDLPYRSSEFAGLLVGEGLGDECPDGDFHQLECDRYGTSDMNFVLIVREHDVEAWSDHLHGFAVG